MSNEYEKLGKRVGALVDAKNKAYGSSFDDTGAFLQLLYPNGIQPNQYGDALALVRIFDKMKRIATNKNAFSECPFEDIAGYGLLGLRRVERGREEGVEENTPIDFIEDSNEPLKQTLGATMSSLNDLPGFPPMVAACKGHIPEATKFRYDKHNEEDGE